ncbi:MAG: hypothetical protein AAGC46_00935 [Solirubrobacteraceae bacterium]|nr:hypothetical protein [Patulibacter sp.]
MSDAGEAGWSLEDGEALSREYPRSFFVPPREHRDDIRVGEAAKLSFVASGSEAGRDDETGTPPAAEQLWVRVTETVDGGYVGTVDDDPEHTPDLAYGDPVAFGAEHVVALLYTADELGYDPQAEAIIDARIVDEDEPPLALIFTAPGDDPAGDWIWFAALDQQPPEASAAVSLGELVDRWPELAGVFRTGEGAWVRDAAGSAYRPA